MDTTTNPTTAEERPPKRRGRPPREITEIRKEQAIKIARKRPHASIRQIATETGISRTTAANVLAKYGINKQELDEFVDNRVDIVRSKQKMILDAITPDKIEKATFKDLSVGYGILLDKDRLESGQSTSNMASWTAVVARSKEMTDKDLNPPIDVSPCDTASPNDN